MNIYEFVKFIFEDENLSKNDIESIIWGCTGYPCFWGKGDKFKTFTQQLRHAKRSLKRGFTIEQIYFGKDMCA